MVNPANANPHDATQAWQSIEQLADELAALSHDAITADEFYGRLASSVVSALAAAGAAVWTFQDGRFVLQRHLNVAEGALRDQLLTQQHLRFLHRLWRGGQPEMLLPHSGGADPSAGGNPTDVMLLVCPVKIDNQTVSLVEVLQRPTTDPAAQRTQLNLLVALCESAVDYHREERFRSLSAEQKFWHQSDQFARSVHSASTLRETAAAIANESRRLLSCDRVSVALRAGSRFRLVAVSGVERIERRSQTVRLLERLTKRVAVTGELLRYEGRTDEMPPQIEHLVQQYVDESHTRMLLVVPLREPAVEVDEDDAEKSDGLVRGAAIIERFTAAAEGPLASRLPIVRAHSEIALKNSLRRRGLASRAAHWLVDSGGWRKVALALLVIATLAMAAVMIPADFDIEARGKLQAEISRDIFAPVDGEISEVLVVYDQEVRTGQKLLDMTSDELDLEYERLIGEKRTTQQKLLAAQSERVRNNTPSAEDRRRMATWSAIETELKAQLAATEQQLAILQKQLDLLAVTSPMDGRVQTWDVQRLLQSRPVVRGQVLMTIANVDGPWIVELKVPDHDTSHVYEAVGRSDSGVPVTFLLKTAPDVSYQGVLERMGTTCIVEDDGQAYVPADVTVDRRAISQLRSGAEVVAQIHCGRAPIGYVWLHDLIDAMKTWVLF